MKAVGYLKSLPIAHPESLTDIELPQPIAAGHDLLVKVRAIAVNPVDYKIRQNFSAAEGEHKVLGWDAVGEVVATGEAASQFRPGDAVYYAGDLNRQGSNAEYQLVDERLVGAKPKSLSDAEAAALPLTTITAWELLFEHLSIRQHSPGSTEKSDEVILVVGAAGGVGSILLQLAKAITGATVIATASRESSQAWVKKLGANHVVDHTQPLGPQIEALGIGQVTHVASLNGTGSYFESYTELLAPFGKIAMIWRGGCIIRARFLQKITDAYRRKKNLPNLLLDPHFKGKIAGAQENWRRVIALAAEAGIPCPAFMSALAYFDGYRSAKLPANLLQAQRDYFGAHTYERVDRPRGRRFHVDWPDPARPQIDT